MINIEEKLTEEEKKKLKEFEDAIIDLTESIKKMDVNKLSKEEIEALKSVANVTGKTIKKLESKK